MLTVSSCIVIVRAAVESSIMGYSNGENTPREFFFAPSDGLPLKSSGAFYYALKNGCAVVVGYTGTNTTMIIPGFISEKPVKVAGAMSCSTIERIEVADANTSYRDIEGVLYSRDGSQLIQYPEANSRTNFVIPGTVTKICDEAFVNNRNLASVTILSNVVHIGKSAFFNSSLLADVQLPQTLKTLESRTFANCKRLARLEIPAGVTNIVPDFVSECDQLRRIDVARGNTVYRGNPDGVVFTQDGASLVRYPSGRPGRYEVPKGVKRIEPQAFCGCTALSRVIIPEGVTSIDLETFTHCSALLSIDLPSSVTYIAAQAFQGCTNLVRVCFAGNAPMAGSYAFETTNPRLAIYFLPGTTGWGPTFGGRPTKEWKQ